MIPILQMNDANGAEIEWLIIRKPKKVVKLRAAQSLVTQTKVPELLEAWSSFTLEYAIEIRYEVFEGANKMVTRH